MTTLEWCSNCRNGFHPEDGLCKQPCGCLMCMEQGSETLGIKGINAVNKVTPKAKAEPSNGFVKHDAEKVRYELLPSHALDQVAKVFTFGARKYADENYLKGTGWRRYIGAALRHLHAFARGEDNDPETGVSHLAHLACCALMLLELQRVKTGTDDRVKDARA